MVERQDGGFDLRAVLGFARTDVEVGVDLAVGLKGGEVGLHVAGYEDCGDALGVRDSGFECL